MTKILIRIYPGKKTGMAIKQHGCEMVGVNDLTIFSVIIIKTLTKY